MRLRDQKLANTNEDRKQVVQAAEDERRDQIDKARVAHQAKAEERMAEAAAEAAERKRAIEEAAARHDPLATASLDADESSG